MSFAPMLMTMLPMMMSMMNKGGSEGERSSTYTEGQQGGINDILNMIKGMGNGDINQSPQYQGANEWLSSMFNDPEFFNKFEAPMQRDFQENTIPNLANRFASMGSGGAMGSTAFRNQLGRESSNLHTNIAALRGGMQANAIPQMFQSAQMPINNLMNMFQTALQPQPNNVYQPPSNPWAPVAGAAIQGLFQNPNMFGGGQQQKIPGQGSAVY
jgi:hypothetical protein